MQLLDIISRVQFKCDDLDGSYITAEYCSAGAQEVNEWLYLKLLDVDHTFDTISMVLPNVQAGIPDLSAYQANGQPLATLVQPRMVRWKLPGQDASFFRKADGPVDFARDIQPVPYLDSWAWTRYNILLSKFSTNLDLEVTGDFLFDPVNAPESAMEISLIANRCFSCKLAAEVGKARGNANWIQLYSADADEAIDDLRLAISRARQGNTERVARMSRGRTATGPILNTR